MNIEQKFKKWLDNITVAQKTELYRLIDIADDGPQMQQDGVYLKKCSCFNWPHAYSNVCMVHSIKNFMNKSFETLGNLDFYKSHFEENTKFEINDEADTLDEKELKVSKWSRTH